jgi:hypothetical protein
MYITKIGLIMDDHGSLNLTSLSLIYRFDNILYVRTVFLQLNTFCYARLRLIPLCHELLYIHGFVLYNVSLTLVDAT